LTKTFTRGQQQNQYNKLWIIAIQQWDACQCVKLHKLLFHAKGVSILKFDTPPENEHDLFNKYGRLKLSLMSKPVINFWVYELAFQNEIIFREF
jgi:hypothetical protein